MNDRGPTSDESWGRPSWARGIPKVRNNEQQDNNLSQTYLALAILSADILFILIDDNLWNPLRVVGQAKDEECADKQPD